MPSSSAHCVTGNTTSAIAAVSDITKSATTNRSSAFKRSATPDARGADTTGLLPNTSIALRSSAFSSSYALRPTPGNQSTPQTSMMCLRATGSSSLR